MTTRSSDDSPEAPPFRSAPDDRAYGHVREGVEDADDRPDDDASPEAQLARLLAVLADPSAATGLSLARVSKRSGLPMSTLRRLLTALADADLARWSLEESGRGVACLTDAGRAAISGLSISDASASRD